jgi:hypothetical protein
VTQPIAVARRRVGAPAALQRAAAVARRAGDRPSLVVGALFAISAALAAFYATKMTSFEPDELGYTHIAMALGDRPAFLTDAFGGADRLNQLYPLTLAPLYRLFGNVTAYEAAHWWNALLMASAVVPTYLLAREVLQRRSTAYAAAAIAAVVPWLTMSSVQLTEVVAYPACAWALFAMQRALTRPSWRADLMAIVAIAVATYGRLQLGILGPVFVAAVLVHELGWALTAAAAAGDRRRALREARRRLLRGHVVLAAATAVVVVAFAALVAAGGLQKAFGYYGNTLAGQLLPPGMWSNAQANFTFLTWGVGVLPMVWTVGLVLTNVAAARARRVHAFACLAALTFVALVITVARINVIFNSSVVQERYVMFVAPLLVVGLLAGLVEMRRPALTLLLGAAVVVPLVATTEFQVIPSSFWFLVSPGMASFIEVIAPRLGSVGRVLGDAGASRFALAGYAIALGCLLLAAGIHVAVRRRGAIAAAIAALVLVFCATATVYSFHRVVYGSAMYRGLGSFDTSDRDWIDRAVGRRAPVALLATQIGQVSDSRIRWLTAEFWNRSPEAAYGLSSPYTTWHPSRPARVRRGGRIVAPSPARYVVLAARGVPLGLAGREVARSPDATLRLVDTGSRPWRAAWALRGLSDDGWLPLHGRATLTIPGARRRCRVARFTFTTPSSLPESRAVRVRGEGVDRHVEVSPRAARTLRVRACGAGPLRLSLVASVPPAAGALGATIRLRSLTVAAA